MNEFYYNIIGNLLAQKWNAKRINNTEMVEFFSNNIKYFIDELKKQYIFTPNTNKYFLNIIYTK